jgi:hypothetical protein
MAETIQQLADRVLQTLSMARYSDTRTAIQQIGPLREHVGSGGDVERERAETWLAICVLYDTLVSNTRHPELNARWQKAVDKATAWADAVK